MLAHPRRWAWAAMILLLAGTLVAAVVAAGAAAGPTSATFAAAGSATYTDSTGEDPRSLDIGSVTVSNDDRGLLRFELRFASRGYERSTDWVAVLIEVDRNRTTGDPGLQGAEWSLTFGDGTAELHAWKDADWVAAPSMTSVTSTILPSGLALTVSAAELGGVTAFDFFAATLAYETPESENPIGGDSAPDWGKGLWTYELALKPTLTASALTCRPDPPRAGKPMTARMTVTVRRGTTPIALGPTATVKAVATLAGRKLVGTVAPSFPAGKVAVTWRVPKLAKGKVLRGSVAVTLEGVTVKRMFAERVL